jgi:hypothetical protein
MHMQDRDLHFTVKGRGEFPVDMLRYDEAKPATPGDQALVSSHTDPYTDSSEEITVNLVISGAEFRTPSADRWKTFGWEVLGLSDVEPEAVRVARLQSVWDALLGSLDQEQRAALDYFRPKRVV